MRTLTARYAGTCPSCGEAIAVGDTITKWRRGCCTHEACPEPEPGTVPTTRERLEAKADKRENWADARAGRAAQAFETADRIASAIPFGQPILVGHHSEGRHRRDVARIEGGMRRGIENQRAAEDHASKADSIRAALAQSIYDDDPDAIERLRAKLEGLEADRAAINAYNKAHRAGKVTPELVAAVPRRMREWYAEKGERIAPYATQNLGGNITRTRQRLARLEAAAARRAAARTA